MPHSHLGPLGGGLVPPPDHLGIGRKSRQFLPAQASCRDPGTRAELRLQPSQLERESSLQPEFGWITGNLCDLSKGDFATTFLSSSLTCPATQSRLSGRGRLLGLSCDSNHRSDLGLSELPVPGQQLPSFYPLFSCSAH